MARNTKKRKGNGRESNSVSLRKIGGSLLAGATVVAITATSLLRDNQDYASFYNNHLANACGEKFSHVAYPGLRDAEISESTKKYFTEKFVQQLNLRFPTQPQPAYTTSFHADQVFYSLKGDDRLFEGYVDRTTEMTRMLFQYLGIEEQMPQLKFHRLTAPTVLQKPTDNELPIYVAFDRKYEAVGVFTLDNGENPQLTADYGASVGEAHSSMIPKPNGDRITLELAYRDPVLVTAHGGRDRAVVANNRLSSYFSGMIVPMEVLHYVNITHTLKAMEGAYNDAWAAAGHPQLAASTDETIPNVQTNDFPRIQLEWLKREEGIVHGLTELFFEEHGHLFGFDTDTIKRVYNRSRPEKYDYVTSMIEFGRKHGGRKTYEQYRRDPRAFFKNFDTQ